MPADTSNLGPIFHYKDSLIRYGISVIKIRWSCGYLIFIMKISILIRWHLYIDMPPRGPRRHITDLVIEYSRLSTEFPSRKYIIHCWPCLGLLVFSSVAPFPVWCVFAFSPGHRSELWGGGLCGGGDTPGWQVLYPTGIPHWRWVTHLRSPLEGRGGLAWICKITRTKGKYILSLRICIQVCFALFCCGYTIIITHEFGGFVWLIPVHLGMLHLGHCMSSEWSLMSEIVNSLWPSDAIWQHRSCRFGTILAQVMACCLEAPNHYLNQLWLLISEVLWQFWEQFHFKCLRWYSV